AEQHAEIGEADINAVGIAELAVLQRNVDRVDRRHERQNREDRHGRRGEDERQMGPDSHCERRSSGGAPRRGAEGRSLKPRYLRLATNVFAYVLSSSSAPLMSVRVPVTSSSSSMPQWSPRFGHSGSCQKLTAVTFAVSASACPRSEPNFLLNSSLDKMLVRFNSPNWSASSRRFSFSFDVAQAMKRPAHFFDSSSLLP